MDENEQCRAGERGHRRSVVLVVRSSTDFRHHRSFRFHAGWPPAGHVVGG